MTDRLKGQAPDNSLIRAHPTLRSPKSRETATWHDNIIIYFIKIVNVQFDLCDLCAGEKLADAGQSYCGTTLGGSRKRVHCHLVLMHIKISLRARIASTNALVHFF